MADMPTGYLQKWQREIIEAAFNAGPDAFSSFVENIHRNMVLGNRRGKSVFFTGRVKPRDKSEVQVIGMTADRFIIDDPLAR